MNAAPMRLLRAFQHYVGKAQTIRNQIRTERMMQSLPDHIRADIGWPDNFPGPRAYGD